jgi:hypothetical protein
MKTGIFLFAVLGYSAQSQESFSPPAASKGALHGVLLSGEPIASSYKARFSECDIKNTCEGKSVRYGCHSDPNHNSALLRLKSGAIFFDAKLGVDADGSPYAQKTPGQTDQAQTSLRYPLHGNPSINADRVPYIVIPKGFEVATGVRLGDVAAVVYRSKRVFAVVGDQGPICKIGEGSIQLHHALGHSVCKERAPNGDCTKLRDAGIDKDVLYFVFPGTNKKLVPGLTPENILSRIDTIGSDAWNELTLSKE